MIEVEVEVEVKVEVEVGVEVEVVEVVEGAGCPIFNSLLCLLLFWTSNISTISY